MRLKRLILENFRNYEHLELAFPSSFNFIYGQNGQGKTNLLEAISLLALGRSFRTSIDKEMIRFGTETAKVTAEVEHASRSFTIEIRLGTSPRKAIKINGVSIERISDMIGALNLVIFSPEDLKLVGEGPAHRRDFMNREISQMSARYYRALSSYYKYLGQRNKLLKDGVQNKLLFDIYNEKMAEYGYAIMEQRSRFCEEIAKLASDFHRSISSEKERLGVRYKPNVKAQSVEEYRQVLERHLEDDMVRRSSTRGVQKDDIHLTLNDMDLRNYGSQGQKRSAAISLKLSEIDLIRRQTGEVPVVLLDDVFSELDRQRQEMLIASLRHIQCFVTTTERLEMEFAHESFHIRQGRLLTGKEGSDV